MPADPQTVAHLAAILHKHFDGDEPRHSKRIKEATAQIRRSLLRSQAVVHGRIARIGSVNRSVELPSHVFALMMDGRFRTVTEIFSAIEGKYIMRRLIYNCIRFVVRFDKIERVGHACYCIRLPAPEMGGANKT